MYMYGSKEYNNSFLEEYHRVFMIAFVYFGETILILFSLAIFLGIFFLVASQYYFELFNISN